MSVTEWVVGGPKREDVMRDTWGHLDAKPGVEYPGKIIFAESCYGGEQVILSAEFGDAGYGPWFYEGIHDWLCDQDTEVGKIYTWTGTYRLDSEHHFEGTVKAVDLP